MCKESSFRLKPFHCSNRLLDGLVGWVRIVAERIQKQHVQVLQPAHRFFGNRAVIGKVCAVAEFKSVCRSCSMAQLDGFEIHSEERNPVTIRKGVGRQFGLARLRCDTVEYIWKSVLDGIESFRRAEDGYFALLHEIEWP